jgi:hypothetical protein
VASAETRVSLALGAQCYFSINRSKKGRVSRLSIALISESLVRSRGFLLMIARISGLEFNCRKTSCLSCSIFSGLKPKLRISSSVNSPTGLPIVNPFEGQIVQRANSATESVSSATLPIIRLPTQPIKIGKNAAQFAMRTPAPHMAAVGHKQT